MAKNVRGEPAPDHRYSGGDTRTLDEIKAAFDKLVAANAPLKDVSREYSRLVLARLDYNKVQASRTLGIDRRSLQRWERKEERSRGSAAA